MQAGQRRLRSQIKTHMMPDEQSDMFSPDVDEAGQAGFPSTQVKRAKRATPALHELPLQPGAGGLTELNFDPACGLNANDEGSIIQQIDNSESLH